MPEGYEYVVVTIRHVQNSEEHLTVELNRVAQHGWKLVGPPVPQHAMSTILSWTATFERPKAWDPAA